MAFLRVTAAATLLTVSALATPSFAADSERGADLAWQYRCMTCHGDAGVTTDERYPHIAGQPAMYLAARLQYFRDEVEPLNQMNGQARQLTDQDVDDLAAYFSEQRR